MALPSSQLWTPAYILHRRAYKENSHIFTLFSLDYGIVDGVYRQKKTAIDCFTPLMVEVKGKAELKTLTKCESVASPIALYGNQLYAGMYINELLSIVLSSGEPLPHTFASYGLVLAAISGLPRSEDVGLLAWYLRQFEATLLQELGMLPSFSSDVQRYSIDPTKRYSYHPQLGFTAVTSDRVTGVASPSTACTQAAPWLVAGSDIIQLAQCLYAGSVYTGFEVAQINPTSAQTLGVNDVNTVLANQPMLVKLLKQLLAPIIHQLLAGRRLRSRELWQTLTLK